MFGGCLKVLYLCTRFRKGTPLRAKQKDVL